MSDLSRDCAWLARARALAENGRYTCAPNPMVGAVIVRAETAVGEGFHARAGQPHAELIALHAAGPAARGATLYVTLEPCCTHGRTPPCTDAIVRAGIARVVAGAVDPNPRHAGRGFDVLRQAGIEVQCLDDPACTALNERFNHFITTGRPFVHAKWAMSLDGKIATRTGASRWISAPESRAFVHRLRAEYDAVMVGIGTVLADRPQLNVRLDGTWRQPAKIVVDSRLRTPLDAPLLGAAPVIIACARPADERHAEALRAAGARILQLPDAHGSVDLTALVAALGNDGISSILVEGGATLLGALADQHLIQRVTAVIAPLIIGGQAAPTPVAGTGIAELSSAMHLTDTTVKSSGADTIISARTAT